MWTWSAGLLAVASVVCLVLALIVPRVWPDWGNHQQMAVLLFALSGAGALGFLFCLSALSDVGKPTARRKRRNRRRRL
jgi:cyanate permease